MQEKELNKIKTNEEITKEEIFEELQKENNKIIYAESDLRKLQRFFILLAILIVILWVFSAKIVSFMSMPTNDMHPRLDAGDLLMFYRLDKTPEQNEIIVFEKNGTDYVSRVVALPGDTVEVTENESLIINGDIQIENDIYFSTPMYKSPVRYPVELGADEYFVLSDSRETGEDSRYFGPVSKSEIKGTVISTTRRINL